MTAFQTISVDDAARFEVRPLKLQSIRLDGGTQSRIRLNEDIVAEYAATIGEGTDFPAVVVFFDGSDYWLADGFHRFHGYRKAGAVEIEAEIHVGTKRDAILYSVGANVAHGLRRTNEDKRNAVLKLLGDEEWSTWADRAIARQAGVSDRFVNGLRQAELSANGSQIERPRTVQRGGTTYQQETAKIGSSKAPAVADLQDEHDRQREEHRAGLPAAIQAIEAAKAERKAAPSDRMESVQAEAEELREDNAALRAEIAALQADGAKWDAMRIQFEKGGFEAVIAGKDEVIRTQATRIERESADKTAWMRQAKFWQKEAKALGFSRDVVIDAKTGVVVNG